jgi:hypothetical protein
MLPEMYESMERTNMTREPVYLVKYSELMDLVMESESYDRSMISKEIEERGNLMEMWDSTAIIGESQKIFGLRKDHDPYKDHVPGYELQWRSFYDGWGEGRIDMIGRIYRTVFG